MNRYLTSSLAISMILGALVIPLRAANKPRAGMEDRKTVWTNDDLEKLQTRDLISIVGQHAPAEETTASALPSPYMQTQDREWYAKQAAKLHDELERRRAQLREFQQALEDARSLQATTGGINFDEGNIGITPDAGIEILQQRVNQTQMELDALEDLARRNDIPSGTLRGQ